MLQANVPAWFEIPVSDIDRAQKFYEALLGVPIKRQRNRVGLASVEVR